MRNDVLAEIYELIERCGSFIPTASLYLNDSECGDMINSEINII